MVQQNKLKTQSTKTSMIIGFILGVTGFLFLFKLIILNHTTPEDELAPGVVVMASVLNGLLFAYIGHLLQRYFIKKSLKA